MWKRTARGCTRKHPYLSDHEPTWMKIRNRGYSEWVGREELFERERGGDPDFRW
jgi:hypothetical protein